jgi:hypothetical protein
MSDIPAPSWFSRVISSDTCRRGLASAVASVLVAAIAESLWPSSEG